MQDHQIRSKTALRCHMLPDLYQDGGKLRHNEENVQVKAIPSVPSAYHWFLCLKLL